jgi:hypothetical protein
MASGKMTKVRQHTTVGEGLAVGVLALGVEGVTSSKIDVEFAFRHAWNGWSSKNRFPQVHASLERDDITHILSRSSGRRFAFIAEWEDGREYVPQLRQDWTVQEAGEAVEKASGLLWSEWLELARAFVDELGPDNVRHAS